MTITWNLKNKLLKFYHLKRQMNNEVKAGKKVDKRGWNFKEGRKETGGKINKKGWRQETKQRWVVISPVGWGSLHPFIIKTSKGWKVNIGSVWGFFSLKRKKKKHTKKFSLGVSLSICHEVGVWYLGRQKMSIKWQRIWVHDYDAVRDLNYRVLWCLV